MVQTKRPQLDLTPHVIRPLTILHQFLGGIFVLGVLIGFVRAWQHIPTSTVGQGSGLSYWFSSRPTQNIRVPTESAIAIGDPIFLEHSPGEFEFAGNVYSVKTNGIGEKRVSIHWRNSRNLPLTAKVEYYETPQSLVWVARTLLPPDKKKRVIEMITNHYRTEAPKLNAKLLPVVREVFEKSIPVIEKSAMEYVRSQRPRVQELGQKYQEELVQKKLIPLLRRDVMPIVEKHASPVVEQIGAELWDRASLWRFGWRYAYDVLPLTNRNLVQAEWRRFVEDEAIPVVESHFDEFIDVQKRIIVETSANPAVRSAIQESMESLMDDRELHTLLGDILQHAVVNNDELHRVLQEVIQGEQAIQLGVQFEKSLQPLANAIGIELFGTPEEGLTPELVAVLRSQILGKDQRWLAIRFEALSAPKQTQAAQEWTADWGQDVPLFPFQNADLKTAKHSPTSAEVAQ